MMRTLGEVRLPTLRAVHSKPETGSSKDFLQSMNNTWSSAIYEIPQVTRKDVNNNSQKRRTSNKNNAVSTEYIGRYPKPPRTPKTPKAASKVYKQKSRSSSDKYYGSLKPHQPRTPRTKEGKCRHKSNRTCDRCEPNTGRASRGTPLSAFRRTPRSTGLHVPVTVPERTRSDTAVQTKLRLPPIQRAYSISALRKHKEAAHEFLSDLRHTFPRRTTPKGRSSSLQNVAYGNHSYQPVRRSRSVNSIADHVSRLKVSRSVQSLYRTSGPNIPLHLTRSHSVNSIPSLPTSRSRARSRGNLGSREGERRSRSLSVQPSMPSGGRLRGTSRQPSRDSTRSKAGSVRSTRSRSRSVNKAKSVSSNTRGYSHERNSSRPPLVFVRLAKTPSAPDIYRTSSRLSLASNEGGNGGRKKLPLYLAIKPENQKTEKEKFFLSNFTYSPVFQYVVPATDNQLQKYSRASDRLLHLAVAIMNNAIRRFGTYEKYMELTGGRKLSRFEIVQAAKSYLMEEGMEDEVEIMISEDLLSRARMSMVGGRPTVIIRATNMREHWVDGMLRHEIGTHYLRAWNNKLQIWGNAKKRKEHNLEPANPTEEGLASLHSIIYRKDPCLWRCAMLYYTIYQATQMSFAELFLDLGRFVKDPEVRWEYCIRAKRGQHDTSIAGAFCKDQVYLNGALQLLKHIEDVDFHLLVRCGKVSYRDLPKLEQIGLVKERTRIPGFMTDQTVYKRELVRILARNGLTQEDLDILP